MVFLMGMFYYVDDMPQHIINGHIIMLSVLDQAKLCSTVCNVGIPVYEKITKSTKLMIMIKHKNIIMVKILVQSVKNLSLD